MSATDVPVFVDWRIATCPAHGVRFNAEEAQCSECAFEYRARIAAAIPVIRIDRRMKFTCPFCGSKSMREESCSRYRCGVQSGLYPRSNLNRCRHCGRKTKYAAYCTRYECRTVAGTRYMYRRGYRR